LRRCGIETSGHRILAQRFRSVGEERTQLVPNIGLTIMGSDHADIPPARVRRAVGTQLQYRTRIIEQKAHPPGTVVEPLGVDDLVSIDAKDVDYGAEHFGIDRASTNPWWRREREQIAVDAHRDQTHTAFLHHHARSGRSATGVEPCPGGTQRRMARERQLRAQTEDSHTVIGSTLRRRQHKSALRQVRPHREAPQRLVIKPLGVHHNRDRISRARPLAEHIDLTKPSTHCDTVSATIGASRPRYAPVFAASTFAGSGMVWVSPSSVDVMNPFTD
jgi:hypothetical protein